MSGKYRYIARLGGGGMAEVFVAEVVGAEGFSRKVAIKRVLPGFSDNPTFAQMFVAEAQITSRLVHPNIVSITDFDRDADGRLFLVMEMVDGKDLDALVATGLLPFPVVIYLITEALRGLGYAHDLPVSSDMRGIIHRDISPHNVLLSWEGAVKVSDFGIAKAKAATEATASLYIKGKPAYMSPEHAGGKPMDGRSDLFAVGVMLWEMVVGTRLFVADDTQATLAAVLFGQIQRPRTIRPDVPKDLERVVMKLLERDVKARYATAEDAITDLLNCAAAPRNGRDDLRRILAERFPHQMPVRQSVMRSQSGATPVAAAPTVSADGSIIPSVSAKMKAETGTIMPGDRPGLGKGAKIGIVAGITLVTAIVTFAIVSGLKTKKPTSAAAGGDVVATGTGPGSDAGTQPDAPPPPPDAAVPPPDATVPPPDAAPPPPDAAPATVPKKEHHGTLKVTAFPAVKVDVGGKFKGSASNTAPLTLKLPVGKHSVRLYANDDDNVYDKTETVQIVEGKVSDVRRR